MNNIQIFSDKKHGNISYFVDSNGEIKFSVEDAAIGFGFVDKKGFVRISEINRILEPFGGKNFICLEDYIPESMLYLLAMKADNKKAQKFQTWLATEVIPQIRKKGYYAVDTKALPPSNIRQANINNRKSFTSILQIFISYANNQGDNRDAKKIYSKFSTLANQAAGIQNGCRPVSNDEKQVKCKLVESLMADILLRGMEAEKHFASIEAEAIRKVNELSNYFVPSLPLLG